MERDLEPGNLHLLSPLGSGWVPGQGVSCLDPIRPPSWAHGEPGLGLPGRQLVLGFACWPPGRGALGFWWFELLLLWLHVEPDVFLQGEYILKFPNDSYSSFKECVTT